MGISRPDPIKTRIEAALRDVTEAFDDVASLDDLTGLWNLRRLTERLEEYIEDSTSFCCAFLEVDRFKKVNDELTRAGADGVLQQIGDLLRDFAGDDNGDPGAYRPHGDEFYLLSSVAETPLDEAPALLDKIREAIASLDVKVELTGKIVPVTVTIGWTSVADETISREALLDRLERAVVVGKARGRNCVVRYDAAMAPPDLVDDRSDCVACSTRFDFSTPKEAVRTADFFCPNCGERLPRGL